MSVVEGEGFFFSLIRKKERAFPETSNLLYHLGSIIARHYFVSLVYFIFQRCHECFDSDNPSIDIYKNRTAKPCMKIYF